LKFLSATLTIGLGKDEHLNLIAPAEIEKIEATLATLLPVANQSENLAFFARAVSSFVLAGGKRIRPQLCIWTHQAAHPPSRGNGSDSAIYQIACGWELFHAFLLVHDDIIDEAETRRGQPSLHRHLEEMGEISPKSAADLSIVAGDLLFSAAMRIFHEIDLPADLYRRQLQLFSRVALTTGLGQALDICQSGTSLDLACEEALLQEYHWKTAAYTFEGPMLSGAILAGADDPTLAAISRFALALGQAYQLQNDLIDLACPAHEGCDILQGKRTVTMLRARMAMPPRQRQRFDTLLAEIPNANGQSIALAEKLRRQLLRAGADAKTRSLIDQFLAEASTAASDLVLPTLLRRGLNALLESLNEQYFAPV